MKYKKQIIKRPNEVNIPITKNTGYIVRNNPSIGLMRLVTKALCPVLIIISKMVSGYKANRLTSK
ncbi:hypothetical protein AGMMS50293_12990 [Spirochaetia bacterium]|nr:hypothetical protein AGMMS50293_12990 [Spirochaetia bacterium]